MPPSLSDYPAKFREVPPSENDTNSALSLHEQSIELCRRTISQFGESPASLRDLWASLGRLGNLHAAENRPTSALPLFQESLNLARRIVSQLGETPESLRDL